MISLNCSYGQNKEAFDIILKNAVEEFSKEDTALFHMCYFLEAIANAQYEIDIVIVEKIISTITNKIISKNRKVHMHYVI